MSCFWLGISILFSVPVFVALLIGGLYFYVRWNMLDYISRVFQEKPLFIIPRGEPRPGAEDIKFLSRDRLTLCGCYLKTEQPRKGVILFGLEFGSNRWSCQAYCEPLLQAGYDIFAFEPRNQGASDSIEGYEPLQWLTTYDLEDTQAAIAYLKNRPDADPNGIGFFGISKGANAGLIAAAADRSVRCVVTDGAFGTYSTMIPFMRRWVSVYNKSYLTHGVLPSWFYGMVALAGVAQVERERGVKFLHLESAMSRLKRPLLMIHGGSDSYIDPEMAHELFKRASGLKVFWLVKKAKHNQAINLAGEEYAQKVVSFFDVHLSGLEPTAVPVETSHDMPAHGEAVVA